MSLLFRPTDDWDLENWVNYGDQTDLWSSPTHVDCTPNTNPNTNWWDGTASGLYATNISASSSSMTFMFNPICDVFPETLDFNPVAVGDSLDQTFTIVNLGASPLVGSVSETCDPFTIVTGESYNIAPGGSHDVTIRYKPTAVGSDDCTIDTGSIYCDAVYCTGESFIRECIVEPDTLDFGTVEVSSFSQLSFKIRNDGAEILSGNLTYACTGFIVPTTSYVIAPGDSILVTVMFLPQSLGPYECVIDTDYGLCKDVVCIGTAADLTPPPPPEGFDVAFSNTTGNLLSWDSSPASDFDTFKIYRSENGELLLDSPPDTTWLEVHSTPDTTWTDPISDGWQYRYVVTALDGSGNESLPAAPTVLTGITGNAAPLKFALHQSVPNPFNPTTTISYSVPAGGGLVTIRVFDVAGRLVRTLMNGQAPPGTNTVTWDGRNDNGENVATGIFFCRMQAPGFEQTMKMTLLK